MLKTLNNRGMFDCPLSEKLSLVETVNQILTLSNLARDPDHTLLGIEGPARQCGDAFLEKGIMLVVDGADPNLVRKIMAEYAYSSFKPGVELQRADIIIEGVLAIQAGDNPMIIGEILMSMLGQDVINRVTCVELDNRGIRYEVIDAS